MASKAVDTRNIFDLAAAAMAGDPGPISDAFASAEATSGDPALDLIQAQSLDELDAAASSETVGLEEVEGVKLRVLGLKVLPSSIEAPEGLPFYLLASCVTPEGIDHLVTVGGRTPTAYLVRRAQLGGIPMGEDEFLVFSKAKKATRAGYFPWNVAKVKGDSF